MTPTIRPALPKSPCCQVPLTGGPAGGAVTWCPDCGRSIHASQLSREVEITTAEVAR